ncbi:MAG TPA: VWA domain-containing protein [bacterium]|nr:VWA domain-containing protein [bacterium]
MRFGDPAYFGLLVLVPAVVVLLLLTQRRRKEAQARFADPALLQAIAPQERPAMAVAHVVLLGLALLLVVVGLARPKGGVIEEATSGEGIDIVFALDISKSMQVDDVYPSRFRVMKGMARALIDQNPNDRVGIVAFAGEAFVQCPLTLDHITAKSFVDALTFEPNIRQGTAIGDAILTALDRFDSDNSRVLILFTDGESNKGADPIAAARKAADRGIKIYTVGIGSETGTTLLEQQDSIFGTTQPRTRGGQPVIVKLDTKTLEQIAKITGGASITITDEGDISRAFLQLDKSSKQEFASGTRQVRAELAPFFFLAAAVLLGLDFLVELYRVSPLGYGWLRRGGPGKARATT